jgi:hypothetical protein
MTVAVAFIVPATSTVAAAVTAAVRMTPAATPSPVPKHFDEGYQTHRTENEPDHRFLRSSRDSLRSDR